MSFFGYTSRGWHWGYITSPVHAIEATVRTTSWGIPIAVGCGALAMFGIRLSAMVRGVLDVVRAGRERRMRDHAD